MEHPVTNSLMLNPQQGNTTNEALPKPDEAAMEEFIEQSKTLTGAWVGIYLSLLRGTIWLYRPTLYKPLALKFLEALNSIFREKDFLPKQLFLAQRVNGSLKKNQ